MDICCEDMRRMVEQYGESGAQMLGSHYHCARCNGQSSMMGHNTTYCKKYGPRGTEQINSSVPRHFCCPGDCQFDHPDEFEAEIATWKRLHAETLLPWYKEEIANLKNKIKFSENVRAAS